VSKAYLVTSLVAGPASTGFTSVNRVFSDEASATEHCKESQAAIQALVGGKILVATPNGPRAACSVQEFLKKLGISALAFKVTAIEMQGSVAIPDAPSIILARN
jgi:hypothetical protein